MSATLSSRGVRPGFTYLKRYQLLIIVRIVLGAVDLDLDLAVLVAVLLVPIDGDAPVVLIIPVVVVLLEDFFEHLPEKAVVGLVLEAQRAAVVKVRGKLDLKISSALTWEGLAEHLDWGGHLLLHDLVILFLFVVGLDALPGEVASEQIHHHVADRFKVVSPGLLNAKVGVDAGVARSSGKVLVFAVGDMLVGFCISVLLTEPVVDDVLGWKGAQLPLCWTCGRGR